MKVIASKTQRPNKNVEIIMSNLDEQTANELKSVLAHELVKQRIRCRHRGEEQFSWTIKIG